MANKYTYLEEKERYSEEELLTSKLPRRMSLQNKMKRIILSFYGIMFTRLGKSYEWALEHDKKQLPIVSLLYFDKYGMDAFIDVMKHILKFQFPSMSKKIVEQYAEDFCLFCGSSYYSNETNLQKSKECVALYIHRYEEYNGELTYPDGWENELKEWCEYKRYIENAENIEKK